MPVDTFFVISAAAGLERWDINKRPMDMNASVINQLTQNVVRHTPAAFIAPSKEYVGLSIGPNGFGVAVIGLREISLRAPFAVEGTQTFPQFDGAHPVMMVPWVVPDTMRLVLAVGFSTGYVMCDQHLVAIDSSERAWRLPISNLYNDCKLCAGRYDSTGDTIQMLVERAYEQFMASSWNADLYNDSDPTRRAASKKMFSYTIDGDKFIQNYKPEDDRWTELCQKVASEHITNYILPV